MDDRIYLTNTSYIQTERIDFEILNPDLGNFIPHQVCAFIGFVY